MKALHLGAVMGFQKGRKNLDLVLDFRMGMELAGWTVMELAPWWKEFLME